MQALWWAEPERNQVLPLNNRPGHHGDRRYRCERYAYHPGISSIPEMLAPNLRNRQFQISAPLHVPADRPCDGIIAAHGGHSGGDALDLADRRLLYVNNFLGAQHTTVSASVELPIGEVLARATFTPTGRFQGTLELWYGDVPVGRGHIPVTTPITYGVDPFSVGYQRMTPISPKLIGPAEIATGVLHHVMIERPARPTANRPAEQQAALAKQ